MKMIRLWRCVIQRQHFWITRRIFKMFFSQIKLKMRYFCVPSSIFLKTRSFKLKSHFDVWCWPCPVFLCSNVQTIDFCVSVTNQAEWGALWLYNAAEEWNVMLTFIIVQQWDCCINQWLLIPQQTPLIWVICKVTKSLPEVSIQWRMKCVANLWLLSSVIPQTSFLAAQTIG